MKIILEKVKKTEKIVRKIDSENTLVFITDRKLKKPEIKEEVEKLFDVKVEKIRTFIKDNKKIAHVKLKKEYPAIDIATKLGVI